MLLQGFERVNSILCLGAHADDIEIGCGGTLLRILAERPGASVDWVVFSGAGERRKEAEQGAALFLQGAGPTNVTIHDFPDRLFPTRWEEIKSMLDHLRGEVSPDLIFTHRRDDAHQDHRVIAELTWCAFRDHWICEYEIPKYEGDLGQPNVFAPLTKAQIELKIAHLHAAYKTQQAKPWFLPETFRGLAHLRGLECRAAENVAEAFYCRKVVF